MTAQLQSEDLYQALLEALSVTFEGMSFTEVLLKDPEEVVPFDELCFTARIELTLPIKGQLTLFVPDVLAMEVTKAIFGIEEDTDDQTICDAMGEMLNTIAGVLMSSLSPDEEKFEIGLPETGTEDCPDLEAMKGVFYYCIDDEDLAVLVEGLTDTDGS